jgi:hypothetical protein
MKNKLFDCSQQVIIELRWHNNIEMLCDIQESMKSEVTDDEEVVVCLYIRTISV